MLVLLWQPAITVAELESQQNIIAVLLDDSRSMAIADSGRRRQDSPARLRRQKALEDGVLAGLQKKFQTRLYRLDSRVARVAERSEEYPACGSGHPHQRWAETVGGGTADLPMGAVVLLSDGSENSMAVPEIDLETINALRNRRLPVHTVGFGKEQAGARSGVGRCEGRFAGDGRFAHAGHGELSSTRLCGQ